MPEADRRDRGELLVGTDAEQLLRDGQRDDLGVGHHPSSVLGPFGQEIVGGAEHRNEQQVEVGVRRGPLGRRWLMSTADFDPAAYVPFTTTGRSPAVERLHLVAQSLFSEFGGEEAGAEGDGGAEGDAGDAGGDTGGDFGGGAVGGSDFRGGDVGF